MGDRRFDAPYQTVAGASDRAKAIRELDDEEVVHALAAASRKMDAYLANVLAVEVLNRRRRQRAIHWGIIIGLAVIVLVRSILLVVYVRDPATTALFFLGTVPGLVAGLATYGWLLRRPG